MKSFAGIFVAALAAVGAVSAVSGSSVTAGETGPPVIDNLLIVEGANTATIIESVNAQLLPILQTQPETLGPDVFASLNECAPDDVVTGVAFAERFRECQVPSSEYLLTVDSIPDGYFLEIDCNFAPQNLEVVDGREGARLFLFDSADSISCEIYLLPPSTLSTVMFVSGADAEGGDFDVPSLLGDVSVEAFEDPGGAQVLTPADCETEATQAAGIYDGSERVPILQSSDNRPYDGYGVFECELSDGDYFLGVDGLPNGLVLDDHNCDDPVNDEQPEERIDDDPAGTSASFFTVDGDLVLCDLFFSFQRQTFSVDIEVTNDDGAGTATGDDFTIEVFNTDGELVASGMDPEPGTGNASLEITLGVGDYRFGVSGPEGYDVSATVTVVEIPGEAIPGDDAAFTISNAQTVVGVIGADDITTTTTTTTAVPPTTAAPTTAAPTTATPTTVAATTTTVAPSTQLPATGSTDRLGQLGLWAMGLILLGAGVIIASRRPRTS